MAMATSSAPCRLVILLEMHVEVFLVLPFAMWRAGGADAALLELGGKICRGASSSTVNDLAVTFA